MDKNVLQLAIIVLLNPEISQDIFKSCFHLHLKNRKVSRFYRLNFSVTNISSYFANNIDRGPKKDQVCGFHDVLTPMTLDLLGVVTSNCNSN